MIYLKNCSDVEHGGGSTLETQMTEHPITNTKEWIDLPTDEFGRIDNLKARGFNEKDKSEKYEVSIKPGQVKAFGKGSAQFNKEKKDLNEEHAEHLYKTYGNEEHIQEGIKTRNWLLEVVQGEDKEWIEYKDNFYQKYRFSNKHTSFTR